MSVYLGLDIGTKQAHYALSDETSIEQALRTFGFYDAETLKYLTKINVHSYCGGDREKLSEPAHGAGKDLWLSEYDDPSGMRMSRIVLTDVKDCIRQPGSIGSSSTTGAAGGLQPAG